MLPSILLTLPLLFIVRPAVLDSESPIPSTLAQISRDHAVFIDAQDGDLLTIVTDHRMGTDPDYLHVFAPDGRLQERLEITTSTTTQVVLDSGSGTYKLLPVNYTYIHTYTVPGPRPMVVEPLAHEELVRVSGAADLYFEVPPGTPSFTFHAHSMWATGTITESLYDPTGSLVHTFVLPAHTWQEDLVVNAPTPGSWRCRFSAPTYDRAGAWLDGVPNYFSANPARWFEPQSIPASATLNADATSVVSDGARVGVNWWIQPHSPGFVAERDAILEAGMDTARLSVDWRWREPTNDNADPQVIDWNGFNFSGLDMRMAAYHDEIVSGIPDADPVLLFYWSPAVSWQSGNPATWTASQQEEYAEFVLAMMIHLVAPDLQSPPATTPAYDVHCIEILNEPNLAMGSGNYQKYIDLVTVVGQRIRAHPDARINTLDLVASGIGVVWGQAGVEMENWIGKLIDQADPYVDGVNWHQYDYIRIEECHRFAEDIAKVKGWLQTRGDGIADERILMTEFNQHGGPPTTWERQDTFYGALWWTGATLAALRGGVDYMQYYTLVDDPPGSYNYKGMLFNDGPYDPPLFPGGPPHGAKPVYEACAFVNTYRRDQVVESDCDHPEVAQAVTLSADHDHVSVLLANLEGRTIDLTVAIDLPPDMQGPDYHLRAHLLNEGGGQGGGGLRHALTTMLLPSTPTELRAQLVLRPRTLYALTFDRR